MIQPVFKILFTERSESSIVTVLQVDAESDILRGHFPEQPVVPGACMLQTVKEILEDNFKTSLRLVKADNIKFLNMVELGAGHLNLQINYQATDNEFKVSASLTAAETICMKLQGTFIKA